VFAEDEFAEETNPCDQLKLVSCRAADGCGTTEQACLCIEGLTVGEEYYITIGSSSADAAGVYQLDIASPCEGARCCPQNDCNNNCIADLAEIATGASADCNENQSPDECDLMQENVDCDGNGMLDWCQRSSCFCPENFFEYRCQFDGDFNCHVDLRDFAVFQRCFAPGNMADLGCCYRMEPEFSEATDSTVDLLDYYYFVLYEIDGPS
jgi:hypothetical protein